MSLSSLARLQYSVLITSRKKEAVAAFRLASHYGANVELFEARKIIQGYSISDTIVNTLPPPPKPMKG